MPHRATPATDPKRCTRCKELKPLTEFYPGKPKGLKQTVVPYFSHCKVCCIAKVKAYTEKNREKVRARRKAHYERIGSRAYNHTSLDRSHVRRLGTKRGAFNHQLDTQNGLCAVCGRPQAAANMRFAYDHDHANGKLRSVLCNACNGGLGCFKDDVGLLLRAAAYIEEWKRRHAAEEELVHE